MSDDAVTTTYPYEYPLRFRVRVPTGDFIIPKTPKTVKRCKRLCMLVLKGEESFEDADRWGFEKRFHRYGIADAHVGRYLTRLHHLYGAEEALKWLLEVLAKSIELEHKLRPDLWSEEKLMAD